MVVVAIIDTEGGLLTGGIEQSPPRQITDGAIARGQVGYLRQLIGGRRAPKESDRNQTYSNVDSNREQFYIYKNSNFLSP